MERKLKVLGIFSYLDSLVVALNSFDQAGLKIHTVFSPVFHHEIQEALRLRPSPVRYFTLAGGLLGVIAGLSLASYAHLQWNFITGGKPVLAWVPFVVVGFEFAILLGVLFTLVGMLLQTRMPRLRIPGPYDPRFTEDCFGIFISCAENERDKAFHLLQEAGAEEVRQVE